MLDLTGHGCRGCFVCMRISERGQRSLKISSIPLIISLTPALFLEVNKNNRSKTRAIIPPVFNHLDLCPPVILASLYESTLLARPLPQMLSFSFSASFPSPAPVRVGNDIDLRRGEELKLIKDHMLGRRWASSPVDIEKGCGPGRSRNRCVLSIQCFFSRKNLDSLVSFRHYAHE